MQKAEDTGKQLNIYSIWGDHALLCDIRNSAGFADSGVFEHPLCTVRESADTFWSAEATASSIMDAFTAHPELNAIFAHGGAQGVGSVEGLKAIARFFPPGDPNHVIIMFEDQDSTVFQALLGGELDVLGAHTCYPPPDITVKLMFTDLILGQPVPRDIWIPVPRVTLDNLYTLRPYGGPCAYPLMPKAQWDLWPVLDTSELGIEAPTKAMRMELQGY